MMAEVFRKRMQMGLGEAIVRHNTIHARMSRGVATPAEKEEYSLLSDALNEIKIDLGFDCNADGIPDTLEVFAQTAKTSCCRLIPLGGRKNTSRRSKRKK